MRLYLILTQDGAQQVQAQNAEQAIAEYYIRANDETESRGKVIQKVLGVLDNRYLAPFSGDWPGVKSIDGRRLVPEEAASILAYCLQEKVTAFEAVITYGKAKAAEYEAEIARLREEAKIGLEAINFQMCHECAPPETFFYYSDTKGDLIEASLTFESGDPDTGIQDGYFISEDCPLDQYIKNLEAMVNTDYDFKV